MKFKTNQVIPQKIMNNLQLDCLGSRDKPRVCIEKVRLCIRILIRNNAG
jgi:hypothetical protein